MDFRTALMNDVELRWRDGDCTDAENALHNVVQSCRLSGTEPEVVAVAALMRHRQWCVLRHEDDCDKIAEELHRVANRMTGDPIHNSKMRSCHSSI
jgi:hypothetical protein